MVAGTTDDTQRVVYVDCSATPLRFKQE